MALDLWEKAKQLIQRAILRGPAQPSLRIQSLRDETVPWVEPAGLAARPSQGEAVIVYPLGTQPVAVVVGSRTGCPEVATGEAAVYSEAGHYVHLAADGTHIHAPEVTVDCPVSAPSVTAGGYLTLSAAGLSVGGTMGATVVVPYVKDPSGTMGTMMFVAGVLVAVT